MASAETQSTQKEPNVVAQVVFLPCWPIAGIASDYTDLNNERLLTCKNLTIAVLQERETNNIATPQLVKVSMLYDPEYIQHDDYFNTAPADIILTTAQEQLAGKIESENIIHGPSVPSTLRRDDFKEKSRYSPLKVEPSTLWFVVPCVKQISLRSPVILGRAGYLSPNQVCRETRDNIFYLSARTDGAPVRLPLPENVR
jgi:hypothetical protein